MRTKILSCALCALLIVSILVLPSSALEAGELKFAIYSDRFVYGGVTYALNEHDRENYFPYFLYATDSNVYCVVSSDPHYLDTYVNLSDQGYYYYDGSGILAYQYTYNADFSLNFVSFGEIGSTLLDDGNNDLQVFRSRFLANDPEILWASSVGSSDPFLPSRPIVNEPYDPATGLTYCVPYPEARNTVIYADISVTTSQYSWPRYATPCLMYQLDRDSFSVLWFDGDDGNGQFREDWSNFDSIRLNRIDGVIDNGFYEIVVSTSHFFCNYKINYSSVEPNKIDSISRGPIESMSSGHTYSLRTDDLDVVQSSLLCGIAPVWWNVNGLDSIFFWENPAGTVLRPGFRPIPPLDEILPDAAIGEDAILQDALSKWKDGTSGIMSDIAAFLGLYSGSMTFSAWLVSSFAVIPPIGLLLRMSLILGFIMVLLNLVAFFIKGRSSDG